MVCFTLNFLMVTQVIENWGTTTILDFKFTSQTTLQYFHDLLIPWRDNTCEDQNRLVIKQFQNLTSSDKSLSQECYKLQ